MKTVTVVVAHHTPAWIKVVVNSYLEVFSDRLLVVENNPQPDESGWDSDCETERGWLKGNPRVELLASAGPRTHAGGMDTALAWCRQHELDVMVHIEPDCLVSGPRWRDNLLGAIAAGAWMAGAERKSYGPIHPTPSAWRVREVRSSFEAQKRGADRDHARFGEVFDWENLKAKAQAQGSWWYFEEWWDTAHKAWFDAAVRDRATLVEAPDFRHYWLGSTRLRLPEHQLVARFPEIAPFLRG